MTDIPYIAVSPSMTDELKAPYSEAELRTIYNRIRRIEDHFEGCCAFGDDRCRYASTYNELYARLHMAGLPEAKTPISPERFYDWLGERS